MANEAKLNAEVATPVLEHFSSFYHASISVGTGTAVAIPSSTAALANRKAIEIQNKGTTAIVFIGDSTVTAHSDATVTGGWEIGPKDAKFITLDGSKTIWAVSDTASTGVVTWEFV